MTAAESPVEDAPRDRLRWPRRIAKAAGVIALLLLSVVTWIWISGSADTDPPDFTGLRLTLEPVPDEANGWFHLVQASDALGELRADLPESDPLHRIDSYAEAARGGEPDADAPATFDPSGARVVIAKTAAVRAHLERALACGVSQPGTPAEPAELREGLIGDLSDAVALLALGAEVERRAGNYVRAMELAGEQARLGGLMAGGPSGMVQRIIGRRFRIFAARHACIIAADSDCPPDAIALFAKAARGPEDGGAAAACRSLRWDFEATLQQVEQFERGSFGSTGPELKSGFTYHPNRVRSVLAEQARRQIADHQAWPVPERTPLWEELRAQRSPGGFLSGNAVGRELLAMLLTVDFAEGWRADRLQVDLRIAWLWVLHFRRANGRLPYSLKELEAHAGVPLPRDPYGETPFRLNLEKRLLYSVGSDGEDEGGTDPDSVDMEDGVARQLHRRPDPALRLPE